MSESRLVASALNSGSFCIIYCNAISFYYNEMVLLHCSILKYTNPERRAYMPTPGFLENRFCPLCGFQLESGVSVEASQQSEEEYYLCLPDKYTVSHIVHEEQDPQSLVSFIMVWMANGATIRSKDRWCFFCGFPLTQCYTYADFSNKESEQQACVFTTCQNSESHIWQELHKGSYICVLEENIEDLMSIEQSFVSWGLPN